MIINTTFGAASFIAGRCDSTSPLRPNHRCLLNEESNGARLREVNRMASLSFDNFRTGAFRHGPLSVGRNHFVLRRNEVPTGLGFPRWFRFTIPLSGLHAPWNLRIGHESGQTRIYIGGERGRELGPVQREEPVLRR